MFNPYVMKKYLAFGLISLFTYIFYAIGTAKYGLLMGFVIMFFGVILSIILANILIKNPFSQLIEGRGILTVDMTSTGILRLFISGIDGSYIKGRIGKKDIDDSFDRDAVLQLTQPTQTQNKAIRTEKGEVIIYLTEDDYNKSRFQLFQYPTILYNSIIDSTLTKDMLSDNEKSTFANHQILNVTKKIQDLEKASLNMGRSVVDLTRPFQSWYENKWVMIIVFVMIAVVIIMFLPKILQTIGGGGALGESFSGIFNAGKTITPAG